MYGWDWVSYRHDFCPRYLFICSLQYCEADELALLYLASFTQRRDACRSKCGTDVVISLCQSCLWRLGPCLSSAELQRQLNLVPHILNAHFAYFLYYGPRLFKLNFTIDKDLLDLSEEQICLGLAEHSLLVLLLLRPSQFQRCLVDGS